MLPHPHRRVLPARYPSAEAPPPVSARRGSRSADPRQALESPLPPLPPSPASEPSARRPVPVQRESAPGPALAKRPTLAPPAPCPAGPSSFSFPHYLGRFRILTAFQETDLIP